MQSATTTNITMVAVSTKSEDEDDLSGVSYSFMTHKEFQSKFKWFEYKEGKVWKMFESVDNVKLLDAFNKGNMSVDLSDSLTTVNLRDLITKNSKKSRVSLRDIPGTVDTYVLDGNATATRDKKTMKVRLLCITNSVLAVQKEEELKKRSKSRLRRYYSSGIISSVNVLERVANFMGKKKNTRDGDVDSKIWYLFRRKTNGKGVAKLNLVEMYTLLRFLEPQDLARTQECSRALCFVAGQETLWSRLATWRKQNDRLAPPFVMKAFEMRQDGIPFLKLELTRYKNLQKDKRRIADMDANEKCRKMILYPHGYTIGRDIKNMPCTDGDCGCVHYAFGHALCMSVCFGLAALPMYVLLAQRADDKESNDDWTPFLVPTYVMLAWILSAIVLCCCLSSSKWRYESDIPNLRTMPGTDFIAHFIVQWSSRVVMVICFVCLILFAMNLSAIGDGDDDAPASYKEAFRPLWLAEISLGYLCVAFVIGFLFLLMNGPSGYDTFSRARLRFLRKMQPFRDIEVSDSEDIFVSFMLVLALIWIICLSVTSVLLPYKLDDDDSYSWENVLTPVWIAYVLQFAIFVLCVKVSDNSDSSLMIYFLMLLNLPTFVTVILLHIKLAKGGLSWLEVFIPLIIQHSLSICVPIVLLLLNFCSD